MSNLPESQMTARNGRTPTPDLTTEVAKVLAAHIECWRDEPRDWGTQKVVVCTCGKWDGSGSHRDHAAAKVTNAVVTALGRPEVEGQVARAIKAVDDSGLPAIWARQYARAALAAIPEALGAGEVDRG